MRSIFHKLSIVTLLMALVSSVSIADDRAPDAGLKAVAYYCASGLMKFDGRYRFCVEKKHWPTTARFRVIGDETADYREFFRGLAKRIHALMGIKIRQSNSPDLLVVLARRNSNSKKTAKNFLESEPIHFDASVLRFLDFSTAKAVGCVAAPYVKGSMIGVKTAFFVDLSALGRSEVKECIGEQFRSYFGISETQQIIVDQFSWHAATLKEKLVCALQLYHSIPIFAFAYMSQKWNWLDEVPGMKCDILHLHDLFYDSGTF